MMSLWTVGTELSALGLLAASTPLHPILARDHFAATPTYPTPVLLVHGLLGSPTNFLRLRRVLSVRGVGNLASFSYRPALDHQRLTLQLRDTIEAVCLATGSDQLDVVGHSLGGVLARYLLEVGDGGRVRRLVTLGAPSLTGRTAGPRARDLRRRRSPGVPPVLRMRTTRAGGGDSRLRPLGPALPAPRASCRGALSHVLHARRAVPVDLPRRMTASLASRRPRAKRRARAMARRLSPARAAAASRRAGPSTWWAIWPSGWRIGCQTRRTARAGPAPAMTTCISLGRARHRTFPVRCCAAALSSLVRSPARSRSVTLHRVWSRPSSSAFVAPADPSASNATSRSPTPPAHRTRLAVRPLSPSSPRVRHSRSSFARPQSLSTHAGSRASGNTGRA